MYIKSPLNYTGGKYKLLPALFSILPERVDTFVDLFAGGLNVGINANANRLVCNDHISYIMDLYRYFRDTPTEDVLAAVRRCIDEFALSQTNTEGYLALRARYNAHKSAVDLFVLTCYAFNHQIRFNSRHAFNTPFGRARSSYNARIEKNLIAFCGALHDKPVEFHNSDFLSVDLTALDGDDLVYCDPPYLISTGSYNDGRRGFKDWTEREERQLLDLLDWLDAQGVRFALSNVLHHKGMSNDLLIAWSKRYHVFPIEQSYANCSYQVKDRTARTVEVLVTNFPSGGAV